MRIVAIDASALAGGSVSAAVEAAALTAEEEGGTVTRFRLYSMPTGYGVPEVGSVACSGFEETVAAVVEAVLGSDGVILGTPSTHTGPNAATRALLKRLAACFAGHCLTRGYHGRSTRLSPGRRVGLLTSCPTATALASPSAATLATNVKVRRTFGLGGVRLMGSVSIADRPGYPLARARAMGRAGELGRDLARHLLDDHAALPRRFEKEPQFAGRLARLA